MCSGKALVNEAFHFSHPVFMSFASAHFGRFAPSMQARAALRAARLLQTTYEDGFEWRNPSHAHMLFTRRPSLGRGAPEPLNLFRRRRCIRSGAAIAASAHRQSAVRSRCRWSAGGTGPDSPSGAVLRHKNLGWDFIHPRP